MLENSSASWFRRGILPTGYALLVLLVQVQWVEHLKWAFFKVDLVLPVAFQVALFNPLPAALAWSLGLGFVVDTLSGKLWGLHMGTYCLAAGLYHVAAERLEMTNPVYQILCIGFCGLVQSVILGSYLQWTSVFPEWQATVWPGLFLRTAGTMVLAPAVMFPLRRLMDDVERTA